MAYDAIVVGGGAAGLTAAAYLVSNNYSTLVLEKQSHCGGLVGSFENDGFTFDGGLRAFDNAGVLFPMLKQLGINIEFIKNAVSLGIEDKIIHIESKNNLKDYENMLKSLYPESANDIVRIIEEMKQIMHYMDIQYGINNPLFLDVNEDRDYFVKKVFPWMFKYAVTAPKILKKTTPVEAYLRNFTKNQALLDVIAQHFFVQTPAYFALSYFRLYQDYFYPKHGTGVFIKKMIDLIEKKGGEIRTNLEVQSIDLDEKEVYLSDNQKIKFNQLVWAADQKTLYDVIDVNVLKDKEIAENVNQKRELLKNLHGNDSVLTIYLSSNLEPMYFEKISAGHFFYTPSRKGQTSAGPIPQKSTWEEVKAWLNQFCALTTYEISIPVLRDASLAPEGKTGLIVSILFDFKLTKYIYDQGWYALFEDFIKTLIINVLDQSIYPGLKNSIIRSMITTPLTLFQMTGNFEGAITGWSFKNRQMPSENRLVKIANSVKTSLPNVVQAGQWTYSPSGFPVSLITGKLAADAVNKRLKK